MYLPDIDYYAPESIPEACELLARLSSRAKVIAGGTDVLSKMKQEMLVTQAFVSLKNIRQLGNIESVEGRGVVIGAKATHNDLVDSPILQRKYPAICETAHSMANLQVRNRGTIGGNIVNAVPSADLPPILIALGATVTLVGTGGDRTLPLEDFFVGPGQTVIAPDEILFDKVAAVAALDEETVYKALKLIRVEYEVLPAVFDPIEALAEGAPLVHDEYPGNINVEIHQNNNAQRVPDQFL